MNPLLLLLCVSMVTHRYTPAASQTLRFSKQLQFYMYASKNLSRKVLKEWETELCDWLSQKKIILIIKKMEQERYEWTKNESL